MSGTEARLYSAGVIVLLRILLLAILPMACVLSSLPVAFLLRVHPREVIPYGTMLGVATSIASTYWLSRRCTACLTAEDLKSAGINYSKDIRCRLRLRHSGKHLAFETDLPSTHNLITWESEP